MLTRQQPVPEQRKQGWCSSYYDLEYKYVLFSVIDLHSDVQQITLKDKKIIIINKRRSVKLENKLGMFLELENGQFSSVYFQSFLWQTGEWSNILSTLIFLLMLMWEQLYCSLL